jgi:signal transduction histidine kinase
MRVVKAFPLLLLLKLSAVAQGNGDPLVPSTEPYLIRQYSSENGLPQNSVKDLLLDKNNFLWICTENGLVRFDGQRFRIYNTGNVPGLRSNRFDVLSAGAGQDIHLTTAFDRSEIFRITAGFNLVLDTPATRLPHKFISHYSNGIFDCTPLFRHYSDPKAGGVDTALLVQLCSSSFYWTMNDHEIVIRYLDDFYYLNNRSEEVIKLPLELKRKNTQACFLNGVFFFRDDKGKARFFKNGKEMPIKMDKSVSDLWKVYESSPPPDFFLGAKGDQAILRNRNDIYGLTIGNNELSANLLFSDLRFLENTPIYSFQYDGKWQRLFIGTQNEGLFVVTRKPFRVLDFVTKDFSDNIFMAFQPLPGGRLVTSNGILAGNAASSLLFDNANKPDRNCIYRDQGHSIWLSKGNHLLIYDSNFSRITYRDSLDMESPVICIIKDHSGVIWVASESSLYKFEENRLRPVLTRYPVFLKHSIETFAEAFPGELWIATRNGMYVYDIADGKIRKDVLLPDIYVRNIFKAKDSSIWIGTYGGGFFKYKDGRFLRLPLDAQKYLATAHTFLEDDRGFFWISTNHGLFKIRKYDLDRTAEGKDPGYFYYYYDRSSGFNTNEFNGGCNPAAVRDRSGNFYFPSLNGIVSFHPDSIRSELPENAIFIDRISADSVIAGDRQEMRIKPDFNRLVVDVSTPFYGLEDNLRLEYQLSPMDVNWNPMGRDGRIVINRLLTGKYTLTIRKINGWGSENISLVRIPFEVLPYWYNTKIVMVLIVVLLIGVVFLLQLVRTRILRRQNLRLQIKVEERTQELEQSTLLKEKLISVIMHDLRSPLFSQALLINHLDDKLNQLDKREIQEILGYLRDSSDKICRFSTDFLTWYNTQKEGFRISAGPIELERLIREVGAFYTDIARRKDISMEYAVPPDLVVVSDKDILSIIIRNIIDNAVKYTPSGNIRISAEQKAGEIRIGIRDSGPGMSDEKIREVLSYGEERDHEATATFGYRFITELVRILNGTLHIVSGPGKGTTVTVVLKA